MRRRPSLSLRAPMCACASALERADDRAEQSDQPHLDVSVACSKCEDDEARQYENHNDGQDPLSARHSVRFSHALSRSQLAPVTAGALRQHRAPARTRNRAPQTRVLTVARPPCRARPWNTKRPRRLVRATNEVRAAQTHHRSPYEPPAARGSYPQGARSHGGRLGVRAPAPRGARQPFHQRACQGGRPREGRSMTTCRRNPTAAPVPAPALLTAGDRATRSRVTAPALALEAHVARSAASA
jgi:hypothetical protein